MLIDSELAFEDGFGGDETPRRLWRLVSFRSFKDRELRHCNWFSSRQIADRELNRLKDGGARIVSLTEYVMVEDNT